MNSSLKRSLGLTQATAINMIDMVGIGPFVTMPFIIGAMSGPKCLFAWLLGALLAFADGFVWAELGAKWPQAGGSYQFLRKLFGEKKWGNLFAFLYIWQTTIQAPLVIASGAIGFSQYFTFLIPLDPWQQKAVSGILVLIITFLLYRKISDVGKISIFLWIGLMLTFAWLIFSGLTHFNAIQAFDFSNGGDWTSSLFFAGLGQASIKTVYSFLGYYNVCHLGGEIENPEKNIPKSIFISIAGITVLYLLMQISILGVIPWQEAKDSPFIVSTFFEKIYGHTTALVATGLVLWIALASLFAVMLGYSRVPYAAALDGNFFSVFSKVHPTKNFPHASLLILAAVAFVFSLLFKLKEVITAIIVMRILIQFVSQGVGVIMFRRKNETLPFKMWLFPIPAILAILVWLFIFFSSDWIYMLGAFAVIVTGVLLFLLFARSKKNWPFTG
jgi:amino acid transporter